MSFSKSNIFWLRLITALQCWHHVAEAEARHAYRELRLLRYLQQSWPQSCETAGIDVAGTIQHENIIALLDCFIAWSPHGEEDMYLVMEHGGADLQSVRVWKDTCA